MEMMTTWRHRRINQKLSIRMKMVLMTLHKLYLVSTLQAQNLGRMKKKNKPKQSMIIDLEVHPGRKIPPEAQHLLTTDPGAEVSLEADPGQHPENLGL